MGPGGTRDAELATAAIATATSHIREHLLCADFVVMVCIPESLNSMMATEGGGCKCLEKESNFLGVSQPGKIGVWNWNLDNSTEKPILLHDRGNAHLIE